MVDPSEGAPADAAAVNALLVNHIIDETDRPRALLEAMVTPGTRCLRDGVVAGGSWRSGGDQEPAAPTVEEERGVLGTAPP